MGASALGPGQGIRAQHDQRGPRQHDPERDNQAAGLLRAQQRHEHRDQCGRGREQQNGARGVRPVARLHAGECKHDLYIDRRPGI